jgi:hypothetical protein
MLVAWILDLLWVLLEGRLSDVNWAHPSCNSLSFHYILAHLIPMSYEQNAE